MPTVNNILSPREDGLGYSNSSLHLALGGKVNCRNLEAVDIHTQNLCTALCAHLGPNLFIQRSGLKDPNMTNLYAKFVVHPIIQIP